MSTDLNSLKSKMREKRLTGEQAEFPWLQVISIAIGVIGVGVGLMDDDGNSCSSCAPGCSPGCQPGCQGGCQGGYMNG